MPDITELSRLRDYYNSGATRPYKFRLEQLKKFKAAVIAYEDEIFKALYADLKKIPEESWFTENGLLLQEIKYAIRNLKQWMKPEPVGTNLINFPSKSYLLPSPKGVVLVIGPWNFPLQLLLIPVAGAIAAGNCVVLKPSEFAPATALVVEKIMKSCFSEDYVMTVQGDGAETVPAMMKGFRFDHVFYTGSIPVGTSVYQLAAKDLVPVTLELGGKAPCIVEADAQLNVAARRIVVGKFSNAGQMCVAPDYLLVHESVKDKLIELLKKSIQDMFTANPSECYGYNKIINEKRFDRLTGYLSQGKILHGGEIDRSRLFIAPTILEEVGLDSGIMREEIFGPILPVLTFSQREEAKRIIERNPNPLSFYLFTANKQVEKYWLDSVQFGTATVNATAFQFTNHHLPFGGIGQSGLGAYHGRHTFDVFTHKKSVMKTPTWFDPSIKYPPLKGRLSLYKKLMK